METLPVVRDAESVAVYTSAKSPPRIIRHLNRFEPEQEHLEREIARYANLPESESAKAVKAAHDALEQGRVLIDIENTLKRNDFSNSGFPVRNDFSNSGFPVLAVGHLTDERVWCRVWTHSGLVQFRSRKGKESFYEFEGGQDYTVHDAHAGDWKQREAFAPKLPGELDGTVDKKNPDLLLLWEAEWTREREHKWTPPPVRDPALIEHVAGSLYAVLAVWDLSPTEAAALGSKVR